MAHLLVIYSRFMRRFVIFILIAATVTCTSLLFYKTRDQVRKAKTYDTLSHILLTARKTLYSTNWTNGYDIVSETKKAFPEMKVVNAKIMDGWGNGIQVEIKTNDHQFNINIVSAGKDGLFGTSDDLVITDSFNQNK